MSLVSGKRIHGYKWIELPISDDVIERVHELATGENQPELVNGNISFECGTNMTNVHASKKRNCEKDETAKIAQFNVFFGCYVYGDVYKSSLSGFDLGLSLLQSRLLM